MNRPKFSEKEIKDFKRYERIRASGLYNMLDPRAVLATGLPTAAYMFVIKNYDALREAAK